MKILRVTFDDSTPLEPLTTLAVGAAEGIARYLHRLDAGTPTVELRPDGFGLAFADGRLLTTFTTSTLGDAA
ncbi:hypothetical protein [Streptomyces sp. NPDC056401]|uniref:hypothetical protein n=1 Tax=Streptomyces sp. NPDC056401 TaxID=3345809 RepID=UPI0035DFB311